MLGAHHPRTATPVQASAGNKISLRTYDSNSAPQGLQRVSAVVSLKPKKEQRLATQRTAVRAVVMSAAAAAAAAEEGQPLRVMIAGAPAAGKGTQCARIVDKYGLAHISVGDLLRAEVAAGTPAGVRAKSFMDAGDLVPNEVVVEMVKNKLGEPEVRRHGWLLDGYPRSADQAEAIEAVGIRPDIFLLINVPDSMLVERVVGRRSDPQTGEIYHLKFKPPPPEAVPRLVQRSDDTEEKVRNRLATYHRHVDAVVGYYRDELAEIDGAAGMDEVFAAVEAAIDGAAAAKRQPQAATA